MYGSNCARMDAGRDHLFFGAGSAILKFQAQCQRVTIAPGFLLVYAQYLIVHVHFYWRILLYDFQHYALPAQAGATYIIYKHNRVPWAMLVKMTPNAAVELSFSAPIYQGHLKINLVYTLSGNHAMDIVWDEHHSLTLKVLLIQTSATSCFVLGFVCSC
jgi:hypothetical protein